MDRRSSEIISQFLTLTRSDAGDDRMDVKPTDLAELVREVAREVSALAAEKGLTVSVESRDTTVQAAVDGRSFRRMLLILMDNAIEYTPEGGVVTATVRDAEREQVCFRYGRRHTS